MTDEKFFWIFILSLIGVLVILIIGLQIAIERQEAANLLKSETITCYDGGVQVYSGKSIGSIEAGYKSGVWYFTDATTKREMSITGTCIVTGGIDE